MTVVAIEFGKTLSIRETPIPGLIVLDLPVHGDARGWFKENWQREKMTAAGIDLPDFGPVQNNISFNDAIGTTRGIHAEPWDKYVSVATGRIFGAWVDLREGDSFGAVFTTELDPSTAIFVPRGVGNSYQTLEPDTAYTYLVNDHWSPDATYTFLNLADETAAIAWPIPLDSVEISAKDLQHPRLAAVVPMPPKKILVTGADAELRRTLCEGLGDHSWIEDASRGDLEAASPDLGTARRWRDYDTIVDTDGYTQALTDATPGDEAEAAIAVAALARIAVANGITLVRLSRSVAGDATTPRSPSAKADESMDAIVSVVARHYIVRVHDRAGRPPLTTQIAAGIRELLDARAPYGVHDVHAGV